MTRSWSDLPITTIAPVTWGTTYFVTTQFLPDGRPIFVAAARALPAGLVLLAANRARPDAPTLRRLALLSVCNFGAFMPLLFVAAYRLPGGAAAACGALQPLVVLGLGGLLLGRRALRAQWIAALVAAAGVALVVLRPAARLDPIGILAALAATVSMGCGVVLARRWLGDVAGVVAAAWQLCFGGLALTVLSLLVEGAPPELTIRNLVGFTYLSLIGTALAYSLWFRGIQRTGAATASMVGLASPLVATVLGWLALGQQLGLAQIVGYGLAFVGIGVGARAAARVGDALPRPTDHRQPAAPTDDPSPTSPMAGSTTASTEAPCACPRPSLADRSAVASSSSKR